MAVDLPAIVSSSGIFRDHDDAPSAAAAAVASPSGVPAALQGRAALAPQPSQLTWDLQDDEAAGEAANARELELLDEQAPAAWATLLDWRTDPWALTQQQLQDLLVLPQAAAPLPHPQQPCSAVSAHALATGATPSQVAMLHQQGLIRRFGLRVAALRRFFGDVAANYQPNPYHCFEHARALSPPGAFWGCAPGAGSPRP